MCCTKHKKLHDEAVIMGSTMKKKKQRTDNEAHLRGCSVKKTAKAAQWSFTMEPHHEQNIKDNVKKKLLLDCSAENTYRWKKQPPSGVVKWRKLQNLHAKALLRATRWRKNTCKKLHEELLLRCHSEENTKSWTMKHSSGETWSGETCTMMHSFAVAHWRKHRTLYNEALIRATRWRKHEKLDDEALLRGVVVWRTPKPGQCRHPHETQWREPPNLHTEAILRAWNEKRNTKR